jgi:hypothetical protein
MTYQEFQRRRGGWRTTELREREADIASPRPPLNNSITDQAIRELFDRVEALEAAKAPKPVEPLPFAPTARPFSLPSEKK